MRPRSSRKWGSTPPRVESSAALAAVARQNGVEIVEGAPAEGLRKGAPYDIVLIDGAVEVIPDALVEQLRDGGRLGGAIIDQGITRLVTGRKAGGGFGYLTIADAATPALPGLRATAGLCILIPEFPQHVIRNIAIATLAAALFAGTASADTLREALVSTYNSNPTITSQREALKGTDASVAIARAAGRPQASRHGRA